MTLLGTPYTRGKSDSIVSRTFDSKIEEGLVVVDAGDGKVATMASGKTPFGVAGASEIVGIAVVLAGLDVAVQADDTCVPTVGGSVYVTDAGKVTSVSTDNTQINAVFTVDEVDANGRVDNSATPRRNQKNVKISFIGGF